MNHKIHTFFLNIKPNSDQPLQSKKPCMCTRGELPQPLDNYILNSILLMITTEYIYITVPLYMSLCSAPCCDCSSQ